MCFVDAVRVSQVLYVLLQPVEQWWCVLACNWVCGQLVVVASVLFLHRIPITVQYSRTADVCGPWAGVGAGGLVSC